jgi:hypothetical protein
LPNSRAPGPLPGNVSSANDNMACSVPEPPATSRKNLIRSLFLRFIRIRARAGKGWHYGVTELVGSRTSVLLRIDGLVCVFDPSKRLRGSACTQHGCHIHTTEAQGATHRARTQPGCSETRPQVTVTRPPCRFPPVRKQKPFFPPLYMDDLLLFPEH